MSTIRISARVDREAWQDLKQLAEDTEQTTASLLTVAIREFVRRSGRARDVAQHTADSIAENERLGRLLSE